MSLFKTKERIIEAEQYFKGKEVKGICTCIERGPHVHTIHEGQFVFVEEGDWIVPEPDDKGYYPIKDKIFKERYDPI